MSYGLVKYHYIYKKDGNKIKVPSKQKPNMEACFKVLFKKNSLVAWFLLLIKLK